MPNDAERVARDLRDRNWAAAHAGCHGDDKVLAEAYGLLGNNLFVDQLEAMLLEWPESHASLEALADSAGTDGYHSAAESYVRRALSSRSDCRICGYILASSLTFLRRYGEAQATLEPLCQQNPSMVLAWQGLSEVYRAQGRWDDALGALRRGLEANPWNGSLLVDVFSIAQDRERAEDVEVFGRAWRLLRDGSFLSRMAARKLSAIERQSQSAVVLETQLSGKAWLIASKWDDAYQKDLETPEIIWSGSQRMAPGDTVYFYFTAPRKSVEYVGMVESEPWPNEQPGGSWSYWVGISKLAKLKVPISLEKLRSDPRTRRWGALRTLQGGYKQIPDSVASALSSMILEAKKMPLTSRSVGSPARTAGTLAIGDPHSHMEGVLAIVGRALKFEVGVTRRDSQKAADRSGLRVQDVDYDISHLVAPLTPTERTAVNNIDVLWIRSGRISRAIEVESSTPFFRGSVRISKIPEVVRATDFRGILVVPDDKVSEFRTWVVGALHPSIRARLYFCTFSGLQRLADDEDWGAFDALSLPVGV